MLILQKKIIFWNLRWLDIFLLFPMSIISFIGIGSLFFYYPVLHPAQPSFRIIKNGNYQSTISQKHTTNVSRYTALLYYTWREHIRTSIYPKVIIHGKSNKLLNSRFSTSLTTRNIWPYDHLAAWACRIPDDWFSATRKDGAARGQAGKVSSNGALS